MQRRWSGVSHRRQQQRPVRLAYLEVVCEDTSDDIERDVRACVSEMRRVVDGRSAGVPSDGASVRGNERHLRRRQRVVHAQLTLAVRTEPRRVSHLRGGIGGGGGCGHVELCRRRRAAVCVRADWDESRCDGGCEEGTNPPRREAQTRGDRRGGAMQTRRCWGGRRRQNAGHSASASASQPRGLTTYRQPRSHSTERSVRAPYASLTTNHSRAMLSILILPELLTCPVLCRGRRVGSSAHAAAAGCEHARTANRKEPG